MEHINTFKNIYEHFKIDSALFRELHVGITMVDYVEKLYIQEVYNTVAHDVEPRNLVLEMNVENKAAADMVKGLVQIENYLITRMSTNVLTLDKFGTFDKDTITSPEVRITIANNMELFVEYLTTSLNTICEILISKGSTSNTFSVKVEANGSSSLVEMKQDARYRRSLQYQDLVVDINPEVLQIILDGFIANIKIEVYFYKKNSDNVINVVSIPVKLFTHSEIKRVGGMGVKTPAVLITEDDYFNQLKYLSEYSYTTDTVEDEEFPEI